MTVNTTNITSGPYAGNDVADEFDYTFKITTKNEVSVFETDDSGTLTQLTVDTDFTVAGIGDAGGGKLTRVAGALPTDYTWYVRSNYLETQLTAFASQGAFFPLLHEEAMDKLTFLIQQLSDGNDRTFRLAESVDLDGDFAVTDDAENRASKFLSFDINGDLVVSSGPQLITADALFDNVALMKAESPVVGLMYQTRGYSAAGDGGWAVYYVVAPQAFDGVIDHELANGNIAVLQRLMSANVSNVAAGIITKTIQQEVNDELAGFISTNIAAIAANTAAVAQNLTTVTLTHNMTSDGAYTLSAAENLKGKVIVTDTSVVLTTGQNVIVADTDRVFFVQNDTAQTLTFKTSAGAGVAVIAGNSATLNCDGTNVLLISEPATSTELTTGTDEIKHATPAGLAGLAKDLTADDGYFTLPGGIVVQWATGTNESGGGGTTQVVNFPVTFGTACLQVLCTTDHLEAANPNNFALMSFTTSAATVVFNESSAAATSSKPRILAIGY